MSDPRALLVLASAAFAPFASAQPGLLVSGYTSQAVHRYDEATGAPLGTLAAVPGAQSLRYGPDGRLYVAAEELDRVLQLDGTTGAFLKNFVWDDPSTPADESGGLDAPTAAVFGPDGRLYVASFTQNRVLRYDGTTGAFLDVFVAPGSGTMSGPDAGMDFGPDGHLYVPCFNSNRVTRYNGATGAFLDAFVAVGEGSVFRPRMLRFRGDGMLYVTSWGNNRVLRFDLDGAFVDAFVTGVTRPTGLVFDPHDGNLRITSDQTDDVKVFHGASGAALGTLVAANSGGLDGGTFLEYLPDRELRLGRLAPGQPGAVSALSLRNATPAAAVLLLVGFAAQSLQVGPCGNVWVGVAAPGIAPLAADPAGEIHLTAFVPAALGGTRLHVQAFEPATCRASNLVIQVLP